MIQNRIVIQKTFVSAALALAIALAVPAAAQTQTGSGPPQAAITQADIQHLQDQVYDVGNEITRLRSRDQVLADRLLNSPVHRIAPAVHGDLVEGDGQTSLAVRPRRLVDRTDDAPER